MKDKKLRGDNSDVFEQCEQCKFWKAYNINNGFCDNVGSYNDETVYDFWCAFWQKEVI